MKELFDCNTYLKIPIDTLWKMTVRDRRTWIMLHNKKAQEEQEGERKTSSGDIDRFTDLDIANKKNRSKRL